MKRKFFVGATLLPAIIDITVTSLGQPPDYWTNTSLYKEGNPLVAVLLQNGFYSFLAGASIYLILLALLLWKLPRKISLWIGVFAYSAHIFGSSTWVWTMLDLANLSYINYWIVTTVYQGLIAIIFTFALISFFKEEPTK